MKKLLFSAMLLACSLWLCACGSSNNNSSNSGSETIISLQSSSAQVQGKGAAAQGSTVTISQSGTYRISGELKQGQLVVDTGNDLGETVLILDNASISNETDAAIHIAQAENARIQLAKDSENSLVSGNAENAAADENASGAALYAEDDLDIEGEGTLSVQGYINNGIGCKNDLDINGGNINVYSVNNGIRGADSVEIKGGNVAVTAVNDGLKSTTNDKADKGYINISGGNVALMCGGDGISAETELNIQGGQLYISCEGDPEVQSSKGIKAVKALSVSGGIITIDSRDHALHSDSEINISGGEINAASKEGKAVAAHGDISLSGGILNLSAATDAVETLANIDVIGGSISISAGEDGLQAGESQSGAGDILISGGELYISAAKKGFNPRGSASLENGTVFCLSGSGEDELECQSQAFVSGEFSGTKDMVISLSDAETLLAELKAGCAFGYVFYSGADLSSGRSYIISDGFNTLDVTA